MNNHENVETRDVLMVAGGLALMTFGAGLLMAHPAIRRTVMATVARSCPNWRAVEDQRPESASRRRTLSETQGDVTQRERPLFIAREGGPMVRYTIDPGWSRFTVQAFAGGMLSSFAHSPTFTIRDFSGELRFSETPADASFELTVKADSLGVADAVSSRDRAEIETRMRTEVLETASLPGDRVPQHERPGRQDRRELVSAANGGKPVLARRHRPRSGSTRNCGCPKTRCV